MDDIKRYKIKYENEYIFNKLLRSLKTYNMVAYKDFVFKDLPDIRQGNFRGTKEDNIYTLEYKSNELFEFVHGKVKITYKVNENYVVLLNVEPKNFLLESFKRILEVYKGCPITCARDRFLVDFYGVQKKKEMWTNVE